MGVHGAPAVAKSWAPYFATLARVAAQLIGIHAFLRKMSFGGDFLSCVLGSSSRLNSLTLSKRKDWKGHRSAKSSRLPDSTPKAKHIGLYDYAPGPFPQSYGVRKLGALLGQDRALKLKGFHSQWHLTRSATPQLLLEPRQRIEPIRVNSTIPQSSITRREPSGFEAPEAAAKPRAPFRSRRCHALGHSMRSKVCPLRHAKLLSQEAPTLEPSQFEPASDLAPALQSTVAATLSEQLPTDTIPQPPTPPVRAPSTVCIATTNI